MRPSHVEIPVFIRSTKLSSIEPVQLLDGGQLFISRSTGHLVYLAKGFDFRQISLEKNWMRVCEWNNDTTKSMLTNILISFVNGKKQESNLILKLEKKKKKKERTKSWKANFI